MDMTKLFSSLKIDEWYKVFVYLGGIIFILSLFLPVQGGITNKQLLILSSGIFLFGVGEWKNHKYKSVVKPTNAYTGPAGIFSFNSWTPDPIGLILEIFGVVLIVIFLQI